MFDMRISDDGRPEIKNGTGSWMFPVVFDGAIHPSQSHLARSIKCSSRTPGKALHENRQMFGLDIRWATPEEVRCRFFIDNPVAYRPSSDGMEIKIGSKWNRTDLGEEEIVTSNPGIVQVMPLAEPKPFVGVIWPDGTCEVRLASGEKWSMSGDVPSDISDACRWAEWR